MTCATQLVRQRARVNTSRALGSRSRLSSPTRHSGVSGACRVSLRAASVALSRRPCPLASRAASVALSRRHCPLAGRAAAVIGLYSARRRLATESGRCAVASRRSGRLSRPAEWASEPGVHSRQVALHHPAGLEAGVAVGTGEVLLGGVPEHHVLAQVALRVEWPRTDLPTDRGHS